MPRAGQLKDNPCKNCTPADGRSATCHATCSKYIKWSKEHEALINDAYRERTYAGQASSHMFNAMQRNKSRRKSRSQGGNVK